MQELYIRYTLPNGVEWHIKQSNADKVSVEVLETAKDVSLVTKEEYHKYLNSLSF